MEQGTGTLPIEDPDDQGTQPEEDEPRDDAQLKKGDDQAQRELQSTADSGKD